LIFHPEVPMTEQQLGQEEDHSPSAPKRDRKTLAIGLAFALTLVLLIALNMN
jgi:hypothetical protein